MHDIVAVRILEDEPPDWWETAQRLTARGYERHDVLHRLSQVVSDEVYAALRDEPRPGDCEHHALMALPESWRRCQAQPRRR